LLLASFTGSLFMALATCNYQISLKNLAEGNGLPYFAALSTM